MNHKSQIIIDPLTNIYYASFYIEGLYELYDRCNVKFCSKPFVNLSLESRMGAFAFIIVKGSQEQKCIISLFDSYKIIDELYHWCDVYGSVNANFRLTPQVYHSKLVSLPPSFGIRLWNFFDMLYYAYSNLLKVCIETKEAFNKRKFIGKYRRMYYLRLPYKAYKTKEVFNINHPYIFHLSTLWYNDEWNKNDEGVNKARANFIRACKQVQGIVF